MRNVDHEERRRTITAVAVDLIAREGLEGATLGRIAQEMGASIRVITHYFADKDALLLSAYRAMAAQGHAQLREVIERDPADLAGALVKLCGADEETLRRWRVYVAFWDNAARSPDFALEQRQSIERTLTIIEAVLVARTGGATGVRQLATELISLAYGVSVQRMLDPLSWTAEAITAVIARRVGELDRDRVGSSM